MDRNSVVIDTGTGFIKCGYVGNLDPDFVIPNTIDDYNKKSTLSIINKNEELNYYIDEQVYPIKEIKEVKKKEIPIFKSKRTDEKKNIHNTASSEIKLNSSDIWEFDKIFEKEEILVEEIPKKIDNLLSKISQTKLDLDNLESKIKNINEKVEEFKKNKKSYNNIKKLVNESQINLNNIYNNLKSALNSLHIFTGINKFDNNIYNSHKNTIFSYKNNYLEIVDKIKNNINDLNQIDSKINENRKDIKESYKNIISLHERILGNININFGDLIKRNEIYESKDNKKDEDILNDFIKKGNLLSEEIDKIEKNDKNNEDILKTEAKEEKYEEK